MTVTRQAGLTPHLSAMLDPRAVALGYLAYNAAPDALGSASPLTSQRIDAVSIWLPPGIVVANIRLNVTTPGSGTAPTGFFVGLASPTAVVAQSNDLHASAALTAFALGTFALNAAYTTSVTDSPLGLYYVLLLQNGAFGTTNVQFQRGNGGTSGLGPTNPAFGNIGTLQTALPTNGTAIALATGAGLGWFVGLT